ncbi:uncharacterized protein LOC126374609 [Pectinophora gossypiella]|uniref:uncharacterized protein LOC126374609 n=1 Tax=Pectinophora gossypiella TaxID=13191 RepID=UPI00214E02DC|nr:uncharacterized protein LOC126374609 [Pectinophora gossypiella]
MTSRSILTCLRLLWRERRFFVEEHAAQAMTAVLRALAHYVSSGSHAAVDACLHFLYDLLTGVSANEAISPLSHQSAYSAIQLLACLKALASRINANPNTILSSGLVLHSLLSYQPDNLDIKGDIANALVEIISQWFALLLGALNHSTLVGDNTKSGMFLVVTCHLGIDVLRLIKLLHDGKQKTDFIQTILVDDQEIATLKQCAFEMKKSIHRIMTELVGFIKENQNQISTEEYGVFLKFLLAFLYENENIEVMSDFCEVLFSKGYLAMLPQAQIVRKDVTVRKVSTLVLGEMLKVLSGKYLNVNDSGNDHGTCARDIHMGLVEVQNAIEKPQNIGIQLQKRQPYGLLIYIYFYCQSSENPEEATAPLLPYLVEHILRLPRTFLPPKYIIKALWLVFAMSSISNGSLESLQERVYLEKATDRLINMLKSDPSVYYTHNPAILLWVFTSLRIPNYIRLHVLSQWLKIEDSIPEDLTSKPIVWELLVNILIQNKNSKIINNCMKVLHECLEEGDDEAREEFAGAVWTSLPGVLSKTLIDDFEIDANICHLLEIATTLLPNEIDQTTCLKIAVIITTMFAKNKDHMNEMDWRCHYEYVCLKLSLYLLGLSNNQNDNRVLLTYINRPGFLPSVLTATNSSDDRVACAALQLLSYVVHYFTKNKYQPKSILQIQTHLVIKSLRRDSTSERGASLLQLVYMVLNSGPSTPLVLSYYVENQPSVVEQCDALRALMFRIQLMLCCRDSKNQSLAGWKTLSSIFKHAILTKNDPKLVATLTSQPWTLTLVQFQLAQNITEEFLTFVQNWLTLLRITIKKSQEGKRRQLSKYSLVTRTLLMMKKNLVIDEELKDLKEKILAIVWEMLELSGIRVN